MTNAEHNAQIEAQIDELKSIRAGYDAIAKSDASRIYTDNAREQSARITGAIALLRSRIRHYASTNA